MDDTAFFDDLPDSSDYDDFWDGFDEHPRDASTRLAINGPHSRKGIQHTTQITDLSLPTGTLNHAGGVRSTEVFEAGDCGIF